MCDINKLNSLYEKMKTLDDKFENASNIERIKLLEAEIQILHEAYGTKAEE